MTRKKGRLFVYMGMCSVRSLPKEGNCLLKLLLKKLPSEKKKFIKFWWDSTLEIINEKIGLQATKKSGGLSADSLPAHTVGRA